MNKRTLTHSVLSMMLLTGAAVSAPVVSPPLAGSSLDRTNIDRWGDTQKISYMLGNDIGKSLLNLEADIDLQVLTEAIAEALTDMPPRLPENELANINRMFQDQMREKQMAKRREELDKNKAVGEAFLAENKKKRGVVTTKSGLQYTVIEQGKGDSPKPESTVKVHYHGTLLDGTVFDSSRERGEPATFPLKGVITGWTEALQLMKVGGKMKIFLPPELAYGERGAGGKIGPNTVLVFEIELLGIEE